MLRATKPTLTNVCLGTMGPFVMQMTMEAFVSKKLEEATKVRSEIPALLFAAFPPMLHDNRKSWLARAARSLGWGQRRTRALFYCEARVVTAEEWRTLNERLDAAKLRERERDELRAIARGMGKPLSLDARMDQPSLAFATSAQGARQKRSA